MRKIRSIMCGGLQLGVLRRVLTVSVLFTVFVMSYGCGSSPEKPAQSSAEPPSSEAPSAAELTRKPLFPRVHDLGDSLLTVYEPQVLSHQGYKQITFWVAAVNETKADGKQSVGALKATADLIANFEERTAVLYNRRLDETYFPEMSETERTRLVGKIKSLVRNEPETMPLDVVLAYIAQGDSQKQRAARFSMEPPNIFYSSTPSVLVQFGGEPVFKPLGKDSDVGYAVNTNWDVMRRGERYYLLLGQKWVSAASLQGPWQADQAPVRADELPDAPYFTRVRRAIPGEEITASGIPQLFVVTKPAELIVTDGNPALEAVQGTGLAFVANTSQDIIYRESSGLYYLLLSGRWFQAKQLKGPWSAVGVLPDEFALIPPDHARAHVRVAIPGTDEAKMAIIETSIPKTAAVPRDLEAPKVRYSGDAKFENIDGTTVARAVNTPFDVLRVGLRYYLCYEAVWFESDRPGGPWIVADHVPEAIYTIPADSPAYHVTFVRIYEADDDRLLVGYSSGYKTTYVSEYTVVYGSGYYWPPYWAYYPGYDYWDWDDYYYWYNPYPYSYGAANVYNPVTGTYRHGDYVYGPGGGYGTGASYNERTGRSSQSEYSWDYNSVEYQSKAYNPKRGTSFETSQQYRYDSPDSYESWGSSTIAKGDEWVKTRHYSNQDGRTTGFETSTGGKGARVVKDDKSIGVAKSAAGDLYVGSEGQVYKRDNDGGWQKREDGGWTGVDTLRYYEERSRAANVTPAQRDALQQRTLTGSDRTRDGISRLNRSLDRKALQQRTLTGSDRARDGVSRLNRSLDRKAHHQLNRSYQARSTGNARFRNARSGRSRSGGGFSRGSINRGAVRRRR